MRLFSSAVLQELARKGRSSLFAAIMRDSGLPGRQNRCDLVRDAFDAAFDLLKRKGVRHEYIYRSALVRRVLLGRHSLRTACVLNEFRVQDRKVDLGILNGTSTAYEIKSERDSLVRLRQQLQAYSEVFARSYVVTSDTHVIAVLDSVPSNVGVLTVNGRFRLSTVREATEAVDTLSVSSIFDCLRLEESKRVLDHFGLAVPDLPNTQLCAALRDSFLQLSPRQAHVGMVTVLKATRSQNKLTGLLGQLPASLHSAALSVPLRKLDYGRLISALNTNLTEALTWE